MFIHDRPFCEDFFCKFCQKSSLSFFIATSTHIRSPCQRNSFFEMFINLFHFFLKSDQNGRDDYSSKEVIFSRIISVSVLPSQKTSHDPSVSMKIKWVPFCIIFLVLCSQKKSFFHLKNGK